MSKRKRKTMFSHGYKAALASLRSGFREGQPVTVASVQRYFDCTQRDAQQVVNLGRVQGYLVATDNASVFAMNDSDSIDCYKALNDASVAMMLNNINKKLKSLGR